VLYGQYILDRKLGRRPLWLDPQIELTFRNRRVRSVELTIGALDVLSQTAARYGRRGRKVFLTNQEPIFKAMQLIQSMPLATAEEILTNPLRDWVENPVKFDPEGWALRVLGHSLTLVSPDRPAA